jgi:hypothetical protein
LKGKKFILKGKDVVAFIKAEIYQIRRIVYAFKIRKPYEEETQESHSQEE